MFDEVCRLHVSTPSIVLHLSFFHIPILISLFSNNRKWADELGTAPGMEGTTFNSVSVGFTKTEAFNNIPGPARDKLVAADSEQVAVANRIGEPADVAGVVGLLVSEKARWISGSVVDASGGKAKIM